MTSLSQHCDRILAHVTDPAAPFFRFDVVGDGKGDDARGNLTRRIDETFAFGAGPIDFDHDKGASAGRFAPF